MKNKAIINEEINEAIYYSDGQAIDGLWHRLDMFTDFLERRDVFLWILARLLLEGRIKLHKDSVFLKSSIENQIKLFKDSWPDSEAASGYEDFYWWFFDPECPAGIAWRKEDGSYEIAG
jgi:hypothetical protein